VAGIAKALLPPNTRVTWDDWIGDYGRIRDAIERTYPEIFHDFNARMWTPGGFHRPLKARKREWDTPSKKANFIISSIDESPDMPSAAPDILLLITLRSSDQFTSSVYTNDDPYREIHGSRRVLLMNREDMTRLGIADGEVITLSTCSDDARREVGGLRVVSYDIPAGCVAGYYPECNPLVPLWHHADQSEVPAAKNVAVRVSAARQG
jgi:anaerobic selenocysteine-containing dehydrogenase